MLHVETKSSDWSLRHKSVSTSLFVFIAISITAHLWLLQLQTQTSYTPASQIIGSDVIQVKLSSAEKQPKQSITADSNKPLTPTIRKTLSEANLKATIDTKSNALLVTPITTIAPANLQPQSMKINVANTKNRTPEEFNLETTGINTQTHTEPVPDITQTTAQTTPPKEKAEETVNLATTSPTEPEQPPAIETQLQETIEISQQNTDAELIQVANNDVVTNKEEQQNYLIGEVKNKLARHFVYPPRARRRGWEGEVLLGFDISENGELGNIHIAHSSGYSLLDRSALKSITKVKAITLPAGNSPAHSIKLRLPVIYRLQEG